MTELSGKRIVMTGATGFIGSHVAKRFLEAGAEVYCLVRPESQKTECLPVHEHLHRIPAQMDQAVECVPQIGHADAFLHFAWRGVNRQEIDSPAVQKLNIDGSLRCMEAAGLLGCQVFMDAVWSTGSRPTASWRSPWNAIRSMNTERQSWLSLNRRSSYAGSCS